eukprot:gene28360-35202_t
MVVLALPGIAHMMLPSAKWEFVVFCCAVTYGSIIVIMDQYDLAMSFGSCILFIPISTVCIRRWSGSYGLYSLARRIEALGGTYGVKSRTDGEQ